MPLTPAERARRDREHKRRYANRVKAANAVRRRQELDARVDAICNIFVLGRTEMSKTLGIHLRTLEKLLPLAEVRLRARGEDVEALLQSRAIRRAARYPCNLMNRSPEQRKLDASRAAVAGWDKRGRMTHEQRVERERQNRFRIYWNDPEKFRARRRAELARVRERAASFLMGVSL